MEFRNRRLVKHEDLNPRGTLYGGRILEWVDEESSIFSFCQLDTEMTVTKYMSEINFLSPARLGDVVELGMEMVSIGKTSITFRCEVRNKRTKETILKMDKIVFVRVDENGLPTRHKLADRTTEEL